MATKKISQLTPKGANLQTTDLFEISESNGVGGYVTKSITGEQILDATSFTGLNDAPTSYTGKSGNLVTVNAGETGLTFTPVSTPNQPVSIDVTQQTYYARLATGNTLKACTYNNGTSGVGATLTGNANGILSQSDQSDKVDNVTPALNDIILVKNQASALQNGLYIVTQLGSVSLPFILTRLEFYNEPSEVYPSVIFISEGTSNQSKYFTQDTDAPTIGTSSLVYLTYAVTPTPAQVIFVDTVTSAALPACTYANGTNVSAPASGATLKANANGALGTINGVTMNINARIIVKNQANQAHNGIYQVIDQGTASRPWVLRRVVADVNAFYFNREYPVTNPNSTFFGTRWSISSPLTMTNANWGTTNIVFKQQVSLPYRRYVASLAQTGTNAPTATVLVNELGGTLVWTKDSLFTGKYLATLTGAFTNKYVKIILPMESMTLQNGTFNVFSAGKNNDNSIYLETAVCDASAGSLTPTNGLLVDGYSFIEIQVWDIPA